MLLILQSILVYSLIIWVMTYFGNIAYKTQYPQGIGGIDIFQKRKISFTTLLTKSYFVIPIFIFCFFAAIRYKVGVDCESYKEIFYDLGQFGSSLRAPNIEPGFILISNFIYSTTGTHYLFLFVLAFLQIAFLYYAQRRITYSLKFFGIALMLTGTYGALMNGIRQYIAACILVAFIPLVLKKKNWIWFIIVALLATTMHRSAYLLIPIGILSYALLKRGIPNIYIQYAIVVMCYLLMDKIEIPFIDFISSFGGHAGYEAEVVEGYTELEAMTKNFGFSSWLILLTKLIAIKYSKQMQKLNNNQSFNIIYNLFFIGTCISLLFYNNFTIGRLNYYFNIFYPIILSIALFVMYSSKNKTDRDLFYITTLLLTTNFMYNLYKASTSIYESMLYKFDLFN